MQTNLDLYTNYRLSRFGQTTATGLARLTDGAVNQDAVTDLLNRLEANNRALWQHVKPLIRQVQGSDGVLLTNDSMAYKPHSTAQTNHFALKIRLYFNAMQAASAKLTVPKIDLTNPYH